jgi:hypothetical protein
MKMASVESVVDGAQKHQTMPLLILDQIALFHPMTLHILSEGNLD